MADARQQYEDTTNFMASIGQTVSEFLQMLAGYMEANAKYAPMAAWIKEYGAEGCAEYKVKGSCLKELKDELDRRGIPYIDCLGEDRIVVKKPDQEMINDINREILIGKANYYQEVDAEDLENAIASAERIPNKEILTLHGLNKYQCEVLKNKCNDITKGFMVGVKLETNGLYALSVHAPKTYTSDLEKTDFCKAYTEMAMSLYGHNASLKMEQVDADEKLDEKIASLKGCEETHYIVGIDDPSKYIELNANGFELHNMRLTEGEVKNVQVKFVATEDPNYEVELQKCMDTFYNRAVLDDDEKLRQHLNTKDRNVDTIRPEKNEEERKASTMEDNLINKMNQMIKTGPKAKALLNASPEEAFTTYQGEFTEILTSVIEDRVPQGYKQEDIKALKEEFKAATISPKEYQMVIDSMKRYSLEAHKARRKNMELEKDTERSEKAHGNDDDR